MALVHRLPPPRLLALDLDGTLLDADSTIPSGHALAVDAFRRRGIAVAIVTGRPLLTTRWVWRDLRLDTPLACFNGAWVGIPGHDAMAWERIPEVDVLAIVEELRQHQGTICLYPRPDRWQMHRADPYTADWQQLYQAPIEIVTGLVDRWRGPSCKVMFVTPEGIQRVADRLNARFGRRYHVTVSQDDRLEVLPAGISKAWGLARLAEHLGIPQHAVWAVGDAANDLEMLRWAGMGFAMGQAPEHVKATADAVLPAITARGLRHLDAWMEPS